MTFFSSATCLFFYNVSETITVTASEDRGFTPGFSPVLQSCAILFAKVWVKRKIERKHHVIVPSVKSCSNNHNIRKIFTLIHLIMKWEVFCVCCFLHFMNNQMRTVFSSLETPQQLHVNVSQAHSEVFKYGRSIY